MKLSEIRLKSSQARDLLKDSAANVNAGHYTVARNQIEAASALLKEVNEGAAEYGANPTLFSCDD